MNIRKTIAYTCRKTIVQHQNDNRIHQKDNRIQRKDNRIHQKDNRIQRKDNRTTPERQSHTPQSYNTRKTIVQHQKDNRIHHNRTTPERQPYCTTSTPKLNNLHHQIKASVLLRSSLLYLCIVFNDPTWKLITCHQSWFATCLFLLSTMD